jgi:hypothetical protein
MPYIHPSPWNLSFVSGYQHVADDSTGRPRKRQQAGASYISPCASASSGDKDVKNAFEYESMPPPPSPSVHSEPDKDTSSTKTPRPDITVGIHNGVVVKELGSLGLSNIKADDFLQYLQQQMSDDVSNSEPLRTSTFFRAQRALQI